MWLPIRKQKMEKKMSKKQCGSSITSLITEEKQYRCTDGEVFSDYNDAVSYQSVLRRIQMFQDLVVGVGVPENMKEQVAQGLFDNRALVLKLLGESRKSLKNKVESSDAPKKKRGPGRPRKEEVVGESKMPWTSNKEFVRIMHVVKQKGVCTRSRISQNTHIPAKPLKKLIQTLCEDGHLVETSGKNNLGHVYSMA